MYKERIDKRLLFRGLHTETKGWVYGQYIHTDNLHFYIETPKHDRVEVWGNTVGEIYRDNGREKWFEDDVILAHDFPHEGNEPQFFVISWNEENQRLQFMDMDDFNYFDLNMEIHNPYSYELIGNTHENMIIASECFRWLLKRNKTLMSLLESGVKIKGISERDDFKQLIKAAHRLRNKREARRLKEIELHKQQPDTYTDDLPF